MKKTSKPVTSASIATTIATSFGGELSLCSRQREDDFIVSKRRVLHPTLTHEADDLMGKHLTAGRG